VKLWLLRHGKAEHYASSDARRELTEAGRNQVRASAAHLQRRPLQLILASPYARAQQSAELVRQVLGRSDELVTVPWLTPDTDPLQVLRELDAYPADSILLVAHQPLLGNLAGLLLQGHQQSPLPMNPASLAELEGEYLMAGVMHLNALHHARPE
jgi:phosphohistidine phosphatase